MAGTRHGQQVVCRPTEGSTPETDSPEVEAIDPQLFRMETADVSGEAVATTLYNRKGLRNPIEPGSDLGSQLDKLLQGTTLVLTTPFLSTMGSIPGETVDAMLGGEPDESDRPTLRSTGSGSSDRTDCAKSPPDHPAENKAGKG